jgi:hypothetical protein
MTMRTSLLLCVLALSACDPSSIGRPCVNPNDNPPSGTQLSSPALECPSRLCLIQQLDGGTPNLGASRNTCTAACSSDSDCAAETAELCASGFRCAVATDVGPYCCRKLCVCADDLRETFNRETPAATPKDPKPQPRVITPFACDPERNDAITCANVAR